VGVCSLPKLRYEVDRRGAMVKWDDSTHGRAVRASSLLQDVHAGDGVRDTSLTTGRVKLRDDVEAVDVRKIQRESWFHVRNGVEDESYLSYKEA
jgi:hypothetical protein